MKLLLGNRERPELVLYHAVSSYQLLEVILHRALYHSRDRAVLFVPDFITEKYPRIHRLIPLHFFDKVCLFPYLQIPHGSERQVLADTAQGFHQICPYDITEFSKIYVAGAHFYFSLYLISNKIPFVFFEDAAGMLSRWEDLPRALGGRYPLHAALAEKYGLFDGSNPCITSVICLKRAQSRDVSGEKYRDFSVEDALQALPARRRGKLIRFFVRKKIHTKAQTILLTQQFANLGLMSEAQQEHLYRGLSETLLRQVRLAVKKHPDDTLDYRKIFPDAEILPGVFPCELLPYVFDRKPDRIFTFDSTGCENLKHHFAITTIRRDCYAE